MAQPLDPGDVEDLYELSPLQAGMLFHTAYEPGAGMYVAQVVFEVTGALDATAMRRAWVSTVARHSTLRTGFLWEEVDRPLQFVLRAAPLDWKEEDWQEPAWESRLDAYLAVDRRRGFDLARPPLLRLLLARTGANSHLLVWTHHQICLDGWSQPLVMGEVLQRYEALCAGREFEPGPSRPYRDYIAWLQRQDLESAEAFWRHQLGSFTAPTPVPIASSSADRMGPPEQVELRLEEHLSALL